jgi:cell division protein FtsI (penicillin-binding protein 3)
LFLLMTLAIMARLVHWQLTGKPLALAQATTPAVEPQRGNITDRRGTLLAIDSFSWEIYANPQAFQEALSPQMRSTVAFSLTQVLGQSAGSIQAALATDTSLVVLMKGATEAQREGVVQIGREIKNRWLVWAAAKRKRTYPLDSLAAQVLGCADADLRGLYGVEAIYDPWLRADAPWSGGQLPGKPEPLPEAWRLYLPSPAGRDLVLNLDTGLQYMAEKRLAEAIGFYGAEAGTIVIMDPRNGALLALAHQPTFDPNKYYEQTDGDVWIRSAVSQMYEPGSVFKLITFAAALDQGVITPTTMFEDRGSLVVGGRTVRNAERKTFGKLDAQTALAKSVNVVTAQIAVELGPDRFYRYVRAFGFGKPTEADLPSESHGILREPGNQEWSQSDLAANSYGQGLSVTALQMTNAIAAIANGGRLYQPQAVNSLVSRGQLYQLPPRVLRDVMRPETAHTLTQMMTYTVDQSAYSDLVPGFKVAGKTGTAEIATEGRYSTQETIASFVGFLPAGNPQVIIMVKLVKPTRSTWAEHTAMPTFGKVGQDAVRILEIKP